MEECGVSKADSGKWIATLCVPVKPSANSRQELEFLKLGLLLNSDKSSSVITNELNRHYENYRYSVSAFGNEPFSLQALKERLAELQELPSEKIRKRIEEIESVPKAAKEKKEEIIEALGNKAGVRIGSDLLSGMAYIRERNKEALGKVLYAYGKLYAEIGRRAGIPAGDTDYYLLSELGEALMKNKKVEEEEIRKRRECMVVLSEHGRYKKFLSGSEAHLLWENEIVEITDFKNEELRGTCGSPGTAQGIAVVINSPKEVDKMREGAVLVSPYTDHELVPAMKKAAAIITDEGGILAHAAVISREFKIPCIIGAKIATSVLKDGDFVEVDANKGIVKRVKKI
jgi:phosphohistidine swiveling domain-containing protein